MGKPCKHTRLNKRCPACKALKRQWYRRLEATGFDDIEYGLEHPRFLTHVPDPAAPGSEQVQAYYECVWQVFHAWSASGRSPRDCRVAELLAAQQCDTGTVRGIARTLRAERQPEPSVWSVVRTIKEINEFVRSMIQDNSTDSSVYQAPRHKAA